MIIIYILGLIGVAVFAISGSLAAGRKRLDWVGVVVLAIVTSLGGGTIRDVLLDRTIFWIADPTYLWIAIIAACCTITFVRFIKPPVKSLLIADALGLALFSIVGAQVAELANSPALVVVLLGIVTGVAGGVIRDVLVREIPLLFTPEEPLYSVAALGGIVMYLFLQAIGIDRGTASVIGVSLVAALRFAAIFWQIRLPAFHVSTDKE